MLALCLRCHNFTREASGECIICDCNHPPMNISTWFNLTYAAYLVLPRLWLEHMPEDWQFKFVELLNQIPETLIIDPEYSAEYTVTCKRRGKFIKDPYRDYRRGTMEKKK